MIDTPIYARNIKFLRQIRGDTQGEIAALLEKKSKVAIGMIENGDNGMNVRDLMKLADYFGVAETELLRKQFWRMSDEEIAALKTRWGEAADTAKEALKAV